MPTVPELVNRAVAAHATRVAIVDGDRSETFAEAGRRIARLANALSALSPRPGGRVAIVMDNRLEFVEADLAIALAGRVKVPINPRLSDDEREFILRDSGADVLVTEASHLERLRDLAVARDMTLVSADGPATSVHGYEDVIAGSRESQVAASGDPRRLSQLLYTSGTTGRPKGAMLLDGCRVAASLMSLVEEYDVKPTDGMIHSGPLSHGTASKVLTFFARGARNIVIPRFEPADFVRAAIERGGTTSFMVPTMVQMLTEHVAQLKPEDRPQLRNLTYGGAPMPLRTLEAALDVLGPCLTQVYGSCEAPHPVLSLRHREITEPIPGPVPAGWAAMGVEVRVVGEDEADALPDDTGLRNGELWVRGPNVMAGYWEHPEATSDAMVDGWYRTGDIVSVGADGMFRILDRSKDVVITGGLNVYPAEVERVLNELPGVGEAAVVGVPDDKWGETVVAVIVPTSPGSVTEESVLAWAAERLAGYKKPRRVVMVEALPRGSTGKVLKRDLRDFVDLV